MVFTRDQVIEDHRRLDEKVARVAASLERELCRDLTQCPKCAEVVDLSELEMHEIMGCELAKALYV